MGFERAWGHRRQMIAALKALILLCWRLPPAKTPNGDLSFDLMDNTEYGFDVSGHLRLLVELRKGGRVGWVVPMLGCLSIINTRPDLAYFSTSHIGVPSVSKLQIARFSHFQSFRRFHRALSWIKDEHSLICHIWTIANCSSGTLSFQNCLWYHTLFNISKAQLT